MNADILDSLTERVLGAIFEVSNTLSAGLRPHRLSSGEFPEAQSGAVGGAGAFACQPGARSRVGRRKRLPHIFHGISRAEGPSQQGRHTLACPSNSWTLQIGRASCRERG